MLGNGCQGLELRERRWRCCGGERERERQFDFAKGEKQELGLVWLEEWKSGRIENREGIEKWEDRRDLEAIWSQKKCNILYSFSVFRGTHH